MLFNRCDNCHATNLVLTDEIQLANATNLEILAHILRTYASCKLCGFVHLSETSLK